MQDGLKCLYYGFYTLSRLITLNYKPGNIRYINLQLRFISVKSSLFLFSLNLFKNESRVANFVPPSTLLTVKI